MQFSRMSRRTLLARLGLVMVVVFCFGVCARADFVSGHVYGSDNSPMGNATFTAETANGQSVGFKTDNTGSFSVYLDPGSYIVHATADQTLEGTVHGYPQSAEEDIHLKKK